MIPLQISDLKKTFGTVVACDNVNITLKEGEIFGFIGPNGAGKTTTINSVIGLVKPNNGDISLFGEDARNHILRKDIGFAGGEASFFPQLTVFENLKFVADVKGVPYDRIDHYASILELSLSQKAKNLSLGNKRKLNLAAALLSSPKLIIMDEPTEGIDPLVKQKLINLLEEEKKRGASIFISSHSLSDVQRLCDRVAIIKNGKIIAVEEMEQLKLKRLKIIKMETRYSTPQITLSGVSNVEQQERYIKFSYNGEMKKLVNYLNSVDIENVEITDSDLETMFLHFYE